MNLPIPLPDVRRPELMPSLPAWVTSRDAALAENLQINPQTEQFEDRLTLPGELTLSDEQRQLIMSHLDSLRLLLAQTPEASPAAEAETLVSVTKLLLALPSQKTTEEGAEAKGEAYMAALDVVPSWAVAAAIRKWYRGESGKQDYNWAPAPAILRHVSMLETLPFHERIKLLERLLGAAEFIDCSADLVRGRAAVAGLHKAARVNGDVAGLTFEQAILIGNGEANPLSIVPEMGA